MPAQFKIAITKEILAHFPAHAGVPSPGSALAGVTPPPLPVFGK